MEVSTSEQVRRTRTKLRLTEKELANLSPRYPLPNSQPYPSLLEQIPNPQSSTHFQPKPQTHRSLIQKPGICSTALSLPDLTPSMAHFLMNMQKATETAILLCKGKFFTAQIILFFLPLHRGWLMVFIMFSLFQSLYCCDDPPP